MGEAVGQVLPLAVGVALSPIPIVGVVLMLGTPRARANGLAFIAGWIVGLALVGAVVLLVSSGAEASEKGQPADWVNTLKLVLGVLLLVLAVRRWRKRPRGGEDPELPGWMQRVDRFTAARSAALAFALAAVNPKNLILTVAAAAAIAQTGEAAGREAIALAVFVAIGTVGAGTPVALYLAMGERAQPRLAALKDWMAANNSTVMAVILLLIGAKLIGDGIGGF